MTGRLLHVALVLTVFGSSVAVSTVALLVALADRREGREARRLDVMPAEQDVIDDDQPSARRLQLVVT